MRSLDPSIAPKVVNLYHNGFSMRRIAMRLDICRASVEAILKLAGVPSRQKTPRPFVIFNGKKYSLRPTDGYYQSTTRPMTMLHRDIFEFHVGRKILPFHEINHKDHNRGNNTMENFEELFKPDHSRETNRWQRNKGHYLPGVEFSDTVPF